MAVRIKFDKEKLEQTVRLLRIIAGTDGPNIEHASAIENLGEVLSLAEGLQRSGDTGEFFDLDSRIVTAGETGEPETWIVLQPTEAVILRASAFNRGVRTVDRDRPVAG